MNYSRLTARILSLTLAATALTVSMVASAGETRTIQAATVQIDGVKFWFPSTIVVKKGDKVKIHIVSKVPGKGSVHGFSIDAYGIKDLADEKGKDVEFTADKAGIFPIYCQLHPTHIGGQLVVLE